MLSIIIVETFSSYYSFPRMSRNAFTHHSGFPGCSTFLATALSRICEMRWRHETKSRPGATLQTRQGTCLCDVCTLESQVQVHTTKIVWQNLCVSGTPIQTTKWHITYILPARSPWRIFIHYNFSVILGLHILAWEELGQSPTFWPIRELEWTHHGNSVSCLMWP